MKCPSCLGNHNIPLLTLDRAPISCAKLFSTMDEALNGQVCDLKLSVCLNCTHVWNQGFQTPETSLYDEDYYSSFIESAQAREYQLSLAETLNQTVGMMGKSVVEIGCGDGFFLSLLKGFGAIAVGFEPSSTFSLAETRPGIQVVNDFFKFDGSSMPYEQVDVIVMRHVLEHLEDPVGCLSSLKEECFSGTGIKYVLLEVPNAYQLLKQDLYFDFYNDHVQYFSHLSLDRLAQSTGWYPMYRSGVDDEFIRVIWANEPLERVLPSKAKSNANEESGEPLLDVSRKFSIDFNNWKESLTNILEQQFSAGRKVAVWGAGARGVALLTGLGSLAGKFEFVIDSDVNKWGKYLPVTGLLVTSAERSKLIGIDTICITSYTYFDEIFGQLSEFRDQGGQVIKVYPAPTVLT